MLDFVHINGRLSKMSRLRYQFENFACMLFFFIVPTICIRVFKFFPFSTQIELVQIRELSDISC